MDELIHFLNLIHPLSPPLEAHLRTIIRKQLFLRGEFLLRVGEVSGHILFLRKGLVRSYYLIRGQEVSNWFMKEGDICISILSFFRQQPSTDAIVALEDCECWGITHAELEATYGLYPEFYRHGWTIAREYYCRSEERHQAIKRQIPMDKYIQLMETNPELIRRVPKSHLASFLNVSVRTYYEITRQYSTRKRR